MRHGYGVRTSAAFGVASHSRGGDGRRPSISSLQPGVEEAKPALTNGTGAKASEEIRGGFVLKSRSDEAPVRRRSLVERTGMKNLMQVTWFLFFPCCLTTFQVFKNKFGQVAVIYHVTTGEIYFMDTIWLPTLIVPRSLSRFFDSQRKHDFGYQLAFLNKKRFQYK